MRKVIVVAVLALAGCKDKPKQEVNVEPAKTEPAKTEPAKTEPVAETSKGPKVLHLAAARMTAQQGGQKNELSIAADGTVKLDGVEVSKLTTAGELKTNGK